MIKKLSTILTIGMLVLQSCNVYKRSFGETYTNINTTANYKKIYRLDLSNQDLQTPPKALDKLVELRMLNLSRNIALDLEKVFIAIPNPEQLEVLILDSLNLTSLPKSIIRFKNLKHLSLNANPNIHLDATLATVSKLPLEFLNLQYNKLETLPLKIVDIQTLKALNLSHNQISNPDTFQTLGALSKLRSLWLTDNQIKQLPKKIGVLNSVMNLYIEHNKLTSFPNVITNLENLAVLHTGFNNFSELPIQLAYMPNLLLLHINNCKISTISNEFASRCSLMSIILDNNQLSEKDKLQWSKTFDYFFMASF